jgi:hypothetical protein
VTEGDDKWIPMHEQNKQEARGKDINKDARKQKGRSNKRQTQQNIINEVVEV